MNQNFVNMNYCESFTIDSAGKFQGLDTDLVTVSWCNYSYVLPSPTHISYSTFWQDINKPIILTLALSAKYNKNNNDPLKWAI